MTRLSRTNCEEAFRFYERHLHGRITGLARHSEQPNPNVSADWQDKVLHARIEIGSTVLRDSIEFWVADSGPGIAPAAVERIFERFGRVDTGRGIRGSGLGLAIVKAIAVAHGGTVNLTSSPKGSRFGIIVPSLETMNTEELEGITP